MLTSWWLMGGLGVGVLAVVWLIAVVSLHDVAAGEIRLVSWLQGSIAIYRGPGKSKEIPLLSAGTTIPNRANKVDLDVTDQTADLDESGKPRAIEVQVLASAIVTVGDGDEMIKAAATLFFSNPEGARASILEDILSSAGRRAINQVKHDDLFSVQTTAARPDEREDALAGLWRKLSARDLAGFGLLLTSLNVHTIRSQSAEAQRRQAAAEAQADADIVAAAQARRAREAVLDAERALSDRERELEEARAVNAGLIAQATGKRQEVQAKANAEKVRVEAQAAADALRGAQFGLALNEAIRITKIAATQTDGLRKVNDAVREGGETYFRYRLAEMLPQIAPAMANALAESKGTASTGDGDGEPGPGVSGLINLIQSVLAQQPAVRAETLNLSQADGVARSLAVAPAAPAMELPARPPTAAPAEKPATELRVRPASIQRRAAPVRKR
jgi:flotillin